MSPAVCLEGPSAGAQHEGAPASGAAGRTLLLVTNNRFWRGGMGSNDRIASLHRHLQTRGWRVIVVLSGRPYQEDLVLVERCGVEVQWSQAMPVATPVGGAAGGARPLAERLKAVLRRGQRWLRAVATQPARHGLVRGLNAHWSEIGLRASEPTVEDHADPRLTALVVRLLQQHRPAVVLLQMVRHAWLVDAVAGQMQAGTRWAIDTHDVVHERQLRFHALGEAHDMDITPRQEAAWLARCDIVIAIQDRDAAKFRAMGVPTQIVTVPHPQPAIAVPTVPGGPCNFGFVGSSMTPNRLAVEELLRDIWPRVQAQVGPGARLLVAGSVGGEVDPASVPPGVELTGFLADLDDFYREVDVVVCPVRIGGGLKIKNVEALCKGKPLVTTAIGVEGLEDGAPGAYVQAETADDFVRAMVRLAGAPDERLAQGRRALGYGARKFDEQAVYGELDCLLEAEV